MLWLFGWGWARGIRTLHYINIIYSYYIVYSYLLSISLLIHSQNITLFLCVIFSSKLIASISPLDLKSQYFFYSSSAKLNFLFVNQTTYCWFLFVLFLLGFLFVCLFGVLCLFVVVHVSIMVVGIVGNI